MNTINPELEKVFLDTDDNVKKLQAANFREGSAKAFLKILNQLIEDNLVTKNYFSLKMKDLEARLEIKMAKLETKIIKWVAGLLGIQAALIVTLIKLIPALSS